MTGGFGSANGASGSGNGSGDAERANAWESRFGWRVDVMAAVAYLGGPITGESRLLPVQVLSERLEEGLGG